MIRTLVRVRWLLVIPALVAACKDNGPKELGPPAQIVVVAGAPQEALAGTDLATPISVSVRDANGQGVPDQVVTFTIIAGGGSFPGNTTTATATTDDGGTATAPAWRLGKSDVAQTMRAQTAGITNNDITVSVRSDYEITLRFFGPPMTAAQQTLFTNAAARISAIITGDLVNVNALNSGIDPDTTQCQTSGQPVLNEIIDDVLIYASIRDIDGPGQILAQAGACFVRGHPTQTSPPHAAIGTMQFDAADLGALSGSGSLQDVIIHEMMHVVGLGVLWESSRNLLQNGGSADPRYTGTQGIQGCRSIGGSIACATSVPVENTGGEGTADSHWRESSFNTELMTGFLDSGANPISLMTIGALQDLGFTVNEAAADQYSIFLNAFRANTLAGPRVKWENVIRPTGVLENGTVRPLTP